MRICIKTIVAAVAAIFLTLAAYGQETGVITLHGHVLDSSNSESLFFSSVSLSGSTISNVSNADGIFSLKIPENTPADARITISHLGFLTRTLTVGDFAGSTQEHPLVITLAPMTIELDPARVRAMDGQSIFRAAFYKIRDNYPNERVGMTAFYREMIRKGTAKYLVLNEAVIDIDKAPYIGLSADRVGIYKGRGSLNYDSSDTLLVKLQGGISTALNIDMVKNPFVGLSLDEMMTMYIFDLTGTAMYDGRSFYAISFKPINPEDGILFKGTVYIETESLAIGRVEFSLDFEGRAEEAARIFIVKRSQGMRFTVNRADYVVSYRCVDDKWYYDYCRVDLGLNARKQRSLFRSNFSITAEMAVTDHKEGGIAIDPADRVKFKDILSDQVSAFADDNFWEDYNIIEPDQSIDVVIRRIVRQLNRRER
ncbi:MAG: carboxypeptidase-like regulatory domain-containing protein [Bacteroidales bacterium]|nr:carboxypeptidase-like regulatory domain-containing protein [Bacteroidales bacterium]